MSEGTGDQMCRGVLNGCAGLTFLTLQSSNYTTFLKTVVKVKMSRLSCLKTLVVGMQRHATLLFQKVIFLYLLNFIDIIKLSQS